MDLAKGQCIHAVKVSIGDNMNPEVIVTTPDKLQALIADAVSAGIGQFVRERSIAPGVEADRTLSEAEAASFLGKAPQTLRHWRSEGKGPAYMKEGRNIGYLLKDLEAWRQANRKLTIEAPDALHY